MQTETVKPSVTVKVRLEKFDGEKVPGQIPLEVIEVEETMSPEEFFIKMGGVCEDQA